MLFSIYLVFINYSAWHIHPRNSFKQFLLLFVHIVFYQHGEGLDRDYHYGFVCSWLYDKGLNIHLFLVWIGFAQAKWEIILHQDWFGVLIPSFHVTLLLYIFEVFKIIHHNIKKFCSRVQVFKHKTPTNEIKESDLFQTILYILF